VPNCESSAKPDGQVFCGWGACAEAARAVQEARKGSRDSLPGCGSVTRPNEQPWAPIGNGLVLQPSTSEDVREAKEEQRPADLKSAIQIAVQNAVQKVYHNTPEHPFSRLNNLKQSTTYARLDVLGNRCSIQLSYGAN
jgi:hypothetical protein